MSPQRSQRFHEEKVKIEDHSAFLVPLVFLVVKKEEDKYHHKGHKGHKGFTR